MPEDITKKVTATFSFGPPRGTCATFTYEGKRWVAYPQTKNQQLFATTDRLIGILHAIHRDMISWINARPQDAELIARVLERIARAEQLENELKMEKTEARVL